MDSKSRFQSHCKPSSANSSYIGKAIQFYGKEHFWYEILETQVEDYNDKEQYWISKYNSLIPFGYNLLVGGEEPPIYRGIDNVSSILSCKQVESLTKDLQETAVSMSDLAEKYGFKSCTSVSEFNKGLTYVRSIDYPIRKEILIGNGKLTSSQILEIVQLLKYTYRSYEDIAKQYGVEYRTIGRINKGIFHHNKTEQYPLRDGKMTSIPPKFTYEQVTDIIRLLIHTPLSLREIAKRFNAEYVDILKIKNGTTKVYRRRDLTYPLRSK